MIGAAKRRSVHKRHKAAPSSITIRHGDDDPFGIEIGPGHLGVLLDIVGTDRITVDFPIGELAELMRLVEGGFARPQPNELRWHAQLRRMIADQFPEAAASGDHRASDYLLLALWLILHHPGYAAVEHDIGDTLELNGCAYLSIAIDLLGRVAAQVAGRFLDLSGALTEAQAMSGMSFGDKNEGEGGSPLH
jgi:hypothetical protein